MKLDGNTVLITGGTSGIGLALAGRFLARGNEVIICGRNEERLEEVKSKFPAIHTIRCDVGREEERLSLFERVGRDFPALNILINNAGIQQRLDLKEVDFSRCREEIAINLEAPIHMSIMFAGLLAKRTNAHIVNVSSGLAFLPPVWTPVYGATKAGLHSFTFSLRVQLADTGLRVVEVIPPAVNTNLGGPGIHASGADVDEFADSVFLGFEEGAEEIGFKNNLEPRNQTRAQLEENAKHVFGQRRS